MRPVGANINEDGASVRYVVDGNSDEATIRKVLAHYGIAPNAVSLWGTGTPLREFLWSEDMADASVHVLLNVNFSDIIGIEKYSSVHYGNKADGIVDRNHSTGRGGAIPALGEIRNCHINVGTGHELTIRALSELVVKAVGFTGTVEFDTTKPDGTMRNGPEVQAFAQTIRAADPGMVMISLATYTAIDPDAPAAFSPTVIDGMVRGDIGYSGVVISDSLSASAVSAIAPADLGVRLVQAGGDLACVNDPAFTQPILEGLRARTRDDAAFAERVTQSARRVVALKLALGLAG